MAQVFVCTESKWYQGLAGLKNNSEKDLEIKVLRYAQQVFSDFYAFQSGFTFLNSANPTEKSDPDIILISRDFSEWVILELELVNKGLVHTRKQLRVFSSPIFDYDDFVAHCVDKCPELSSSVADLRNLVKASPSVVVMFDTYNKESFEKLRIDFPGIDFCVFEVYRTYGDDRELYRFSGDYPYISSGGSMLVFSSYDQYQIVRTNLLNGYQNRTFNVYYKGASFVASISISRPYRGKRKWFLEIKDSQLPANRNLFLSKTLSGKFKK